MSETRYNAIVIGGGIVGLAVALEITRRFPRLRLLLLEKEDRVARHQSGHNSGVIHSGVYYKPGSQKAQLCVAGAAAMVEFCREHGANIADLATRFCLDHPYVSSTLIGIATRQEVEASLRLLEAANDQAVLAQVESILAPAFNCEWPSGRPENQE